MKNTKIEFASSALLLSLFILPAPVANAQSIGTLEVHFFQPESVDPNLVLTYANTSPLTSSASDLLNAGYPSSKGLEIHSAIAGSNGGIIDITEVKICFNFSGIVIADSQTYTSAYSPWNYNITQNVNSWCVDYFIPISLSLFAPINNNLNPGFGNQFSQSFASVTITSQDSNGNPNLGALQAFLNQNPGNSITYTPSVLGGQERGSSNVPEPGSFALLGALFATSGLTFWRYRSKK